MDGRHAAETASQAVQRRWDGAEGAIRLEALGHEPSYDRYDSATTNRGRKDAINSE